MASTSQQPKKSHKRKSAAADLAMDVQVAVEEASSSAGPAFVNFPSVRPSKSTPFTMYSREASSSSALTKQYTMIAGETEDVEFSSHNRDQRLDAEGSDCQYLPAIYDPSTQTLHVHPSAPLYLLAHSVKRLKSAGLSAAPAADQRALYKAKRNDLGEAFGTRKAKVQIRAEERNKVDVGAMEGVRGHLMESIGEMKVEDGPEKPSDVIPTPNITTSDVTAVYSRDSIIPPSEWSAIDVSQLLEAKDDKARVGLLPFRRSLWLQDKCRVIANLKDKSLRRTQMRFLYYLSCLLAFHDFAPRLSKTASSELSAKFPGVPRQLIDGLITRFSETAAKKHSVTEKMKTKLLAWICLLYLLLDGYAVEVGRVAKDLKMEPTKVATVYKSLGCTVNMATPAEREKQGLTMAEASASRKAILVAPVTFPKTKKRGPVKR
ncbi:hypothetical protein CI109_100205 [Kwoniella shandongensis]|uniref:Uncharacterized protein n=1 Tax=Kwoniella shandongensis TaxID=1734106 RepID=A0A5M6BV40_9TREE|nr:uncharacterized protein CI109_005804 [Kwoniella shandongensis]KAA5525920.1 hypothetical protein CI109_005804 [Kwoniella shandongensis]